MQHTRFITFSLLFTLASLGCDGDAEPDAPESCTRRREVIRSLDGTSRGLPDWPDFTATRYAKLLDGEG